MLYLSSYKSTNGYYFTINFMYNNRDYTIYVLKSSTEYYYMTISPDDLKIKESRIYTGTGYETVLEISRNIRQTGIKSTISNLDRMRLLYNNRNAGLESTHTPPEDTQPTNFSLKLHKFTLYSGRYKEKEGENRMIFEGNPTEEAKRLGFNLRINNVDSSGVQTITLANPISFNTEEYMRKHTRTNLGKSFNFN